MAILEKIKALKQLMRAVALAVGDKRTPLSAKIIGGLTLAYAASPIDLIPDFIPVLGYLDDIVIIPFGIWLMLKLIPDEVWQDARKRAASGEDGQTGNGSLGTVLVVSLWAAGVAATVLLGRYVILPWIHRVR